MTTIDKKGLLTLNIKQKQISRSRSRSSRNMSQQNDKKTNIEKNLKSQLLSKISANKLVKNYENKKIKQDNGQKNQQSYLKQKEGAKDFDQRSSLGEIYTFILNLLNKSQTKQLSSTEKYMLSGYIDIFVKQNSVFSEFKDNSGVSVQKIKFQWNKICNSWQLYCAKQKICKVSWEWQQKLEQACHNFQILYQQIKKIDKTKQKLQTIRKLLKKFYQELINF